MVKMLGSSSISKCLLFSLLVIFTINGYAATLCVGTCPPDLRSPGEVGYISSPPLTPFTSPIIFQLLPEPGGPTAAELQNPLGFAYIDKLYGFLASPNVSKVTIPYFSDSLLSRITSPTGWSFSTGTTDVFGLGHGAGFITWINTGTDIPVIDPWFTFDSGYGPASNTYRLSMSDGTIYNFSQGLVPLSPLAIAAGLQSYTAVQVPEPSSWALILMGVGLISLAGRSRKLG